MRPSDVLLAPGLFSFVMVNLPIIRKLDKAQKSPVFSKTHIAIDDKTLEIIINNAPFNCASQQYSPQILKRGSTHFG